MNPFLEPRKDEVKASLLFGGVESAGIKKPDISGDIPSISVAVQGETDRTLQSKRPIEKARVALHSSSPAFLPTEIGRKHELDSHEHKPAAGDAKVGKNKPVRWSLDSLPIGKHSFNDSMDLDAEELHNPHIHITHTKHADGNRKQQKEAKIDEKYTTTPFRFVKPNQSAFCSTGYLSKKERNEVMPTPKTPSKRTTTKFVVGNTPFPLNGGGSGNRSREFTERALGEDSLAENSTSSRSNSSSSRSEHPSSPRELIAGMNGLFPYVTSDRISTPDPPAKEPKLTTSPLGGSPRNIFLSSPQLNRAIVNVGSLISDDDGDDSSVDIEDSGLLSGSFSSGFFFSGPKWKSEKAKFLELSSERCSSPVLLSEQECGSTTNYFEEYFEVLAQIGSGSFADVFKCRSLEDGQIYAVKKTSEAFTGMADRSKKLVEVQNLWRVSAKFSSDDPRASNCIQIKQAWEQFGFLYIQTEFCEEGTLKDYIDQVSDQGRRVCEEEMWIILEQLCRGLQWIHERGIVHLDIKPENIFLVEASKTDDGADAATLKIGDFGISRSIACTAEFDDTEGDKVYLAPEVLQNHYSPLADVFSVGLILLEMMADIELPSQGIQWQNLRSGNYDDLSFEASVELQNLMKDMLRPVISRISVDRILQKIQQHKLESLDSNK